MNNTSPASAPPPSDAPSAGGSGPIAPAMFEVESEGDGADELNSASWIQADDDGVPPTD